MSRLKFAFDSLVSLFSLVVMGLSGLVANIVILRGWGAETLGLFNQLFAIYVFSSQVGAFGLQSSALKHIAEYDPHPEEQAGIFASGFTLILLTSSLAVALLALASPLVGRLFASSLMGMGVLLILPGIWGNAVNKYLLCTLNARLHIKAYALTTALRFALIPSGALLILWLRLPGVWVALCLCLAEVLTLFVLLFLNSTLLKQGWPKQSRNWMRRHLDFGRHAVLGGMAVELNSRIDILLLGVFTSEREVGIYSFAAFLFEGLMHLPILARRFVDPLLAQSAASHRLETLRALIVTCLKHGAWLVGGSFALAALLYPWFARLAGGDETLEQGYPALLILLSLGVLPGIGAVLANFPSQVGFPGKQSRLSIIVLTVNAALGLILIPQLGMIGAAIAVGAAMLTGMLEQTRLIRNQLNQLHIYREKEIG